MRARSAWLREISCACPGDTNTGAVETRKRARCFMKKARGSLISFRRSNGEPRGARPTHSWVPHSISFCAIEWDRQAILKVRPSRTPSYFSNPLPKCPRILNPTNRENSQVSVQRADANLGHRAATSRTCVEIFGRCRLRSCGQHLPHLSIVDPSGSNPPDKKCCQKWVTWPRHALSCLAKGYSQV